jgi:hypothetical protein
MVKEVEKLFTGSNDFVHLAPFAASGGERGKVDRVRRRIAETF